MLAPPPLSGVGVLRSGKSCIRLWYLHRSDSYSAVADSGFPILGGGSNPYGTPTYYWPNLFSRFSKNCMKMKNFWPGRGVSLMLPLDPNSYQIPIVDCKDLNLYLTLFGVKSSA